MQESLVSILVVDDEPAMRRVLLNSLGIAGYLIEEAPNGEAAIAAVERLYPSLLLLDISMPGLSGIETCRRIRKLSPNTGIIMMTVRDKEDDKVSALEAGADDYVVKPFRLRELLARMRAVHRRTHAGGDPAANVLRIADLELDIDTRTLRKAGREIRLSQKEFDILAFLMRRPDTPIPRARLLQAVWGPEYGGEAEYLRTYIRHLRRKIESNPAQPQYIVTEPWLGYRFRDPSGSQSIHAA